MERSEKVGLISMGIAAFLVVLKAALGYWAGSMALLADALHSTTDVIASATVWAGIRFSRRRSSGFPYGMYKVENMVSLVLAVLIFLAGYEIVKMVLVRGEELNKSALPYAILGVACTLVITFVFSRYELKVGKAVRSPSLIADARHIYTDFLTSGVILIGLIGGYLGLPLDRPAALVVAVFIGWAGGRIAYDAIRVLLDASLDFETLDKIRTIIMDMPQVAKINRLRGRNSGRYTFIEADVSLRVKELEKSHMVSHGIEQHIRQAIPNVDSVLIHCEPLKKEKTVVAVPLKQNRENLSEHFGDAPVFYIGTIRESDGHILQEKFILNPFFREEKGKGIKVSKWLLQQDVDRIFTASAMEGKGPGYVFSDAGVPVSVVEGGVLAEIKETLAQESEKTPD
jgi:cation diffusion facilitator family transporter